MLDFSKGKIFVSAERGHTETDWFRSYATFNFGNYQHPDKTPFGALHVLNDDTLAAGRKMNLLVEKAIVTILLPVVGAVCYTTSNGNTGIIEAGEAIIFPMIAGDTVEFSNPFETGLVNYLHLWFTVPFISYTVPQTIHFDIDAKKNQLVRIGLTQVLAAQSSVSSYIGKFKGREEAVYTISETGSGVFVFVLEGAFEVQYRLLETRDSLALWNVKEVELEALSDNAILLLVELPVADSIKPQQLI